MINIIIISIIAILGISHVIVARKYYGTIVEIILFWMFITSVVVGPIIGDILS